MMRTISIALLCSLALLPPISRLNARETGLRWVFNPGTIENGLLKPALTAEATISVK